MATKTKAKNKALHTSHAPKARKEDPQAQLNTGILIGLIIALVAIVVTYLLSSEMLSGKNDATSYRGKLVCGAGCVRDSQCSGGLTCQPNSLGKKVCTCYTGQACAAGKCITPQYGTAEEGAECDKTLTDRGLNGTTIPATAISRVCKQGAQCKYIARLQGSGYKCCTPGSAHPNCQGNVPSGIQSMP